MWGNTPILQIFTLCLEDKHQSYLFEAQDPNSNETGFDSFKDQVRHISYNKEGFFINFGSVWKRIINNSDINMNM